MTSGSVAKKGMECLLHDVGHGTGVDLHLLIKGGHGFGIGRKTPSHVAPAMTVAAMQRLLPITDEASTTGVSQKQQHVQGQNRGQQKTFVIARYRPTCSSR